METYCETRKCKDLEGKDGSFKEKYIYNKLMMTFHREKMDWVSELKREELEASKLDRGKGKITVRFIETKSSTSNAAESITASCYTIAATVYGIFIIKKVNAVLVCTL